MIATDFSSIAASFNNSFYEKLCWKWVEIEAVSRQHPFLYNPLRGTEMKYWREMDKYKK